MGYVVRATEVRQLRCPLTGAEIAQRAERVAELLADEDQIDADLAASKARFKAKAEECQRERRALLGEFRMRSALRNVDCELQLDLEAKRAQWVRTDTGEVLLERALSDEERQGHLFDEPVEGEGEGEEGEPDAEASAVDRGALRERDERRARRGKRATNDSPAH